MDAPEPCSLTSAYKAPHFYDVNFLVILAITILVLDQCCQPRELRDPESRNKEEIGLQNVLCKATTLKINPRERTRTTTGSTLRPGDSSV